MTALQTAPAATAPAPLPRAHLLRCWSRIALPLVAVKVLGQGLEFAGWVLLARTGGAQQFGELTVAFLVCRYAGIVADWGAALQGVRDVARGGTPGQVLALVRRRRFVALVLSAAYVAAVLLLGRTDLLPLVTVVLARGLGRDWLALGRAKPLRAGVPIAGQGALLLLGAALAPALLPAPVLVGAAYAGGALLSVALNRLERAPHGRAAAPPVWMTLALLADQVVASVDTLLLAWVHGAGPAGIYAAVYRLPNACLAVVGLLAMGLVPVVVAQLAERPEALPLLRRRLLRASGAGAGLVLALGPVAWVLVPVLLGPDYEDGRTPLLLLFVMVAVTTLAAPLHPLFVAIHSPKRYAAVQGLAAGAALAGHVALLQPLGLLGAALVTLAVQVGLLLLLLHGTRAAQAALPTRTEPLPC